MKLTIISTNPAHGISMEIPAHVNEVKITLNEYSIAISTDTLPGAMTVSKPPVTATRQPGPSAATKNVLKQYLKEQKRKEKPDEKPAKKRQGWIGERSAEYRAKLSAASKEFHRKRRLQAKRQAREAAGSKAGLTRWSNTTEEQRRDHSMMMQQKRLAKLRHRLDTEKEANGNNVITEEKTHEAI